MSYRSRGGETLLFKDLVADHYLPSIKDAAPNTRKNTASHLGDGSGVPVRKGPYAARAARTQLLFAFGHRPIGAIGPNEVQQWISQMAVDGYDHDTMRAKRSLLRTILQVAVSQGWLPDNVVDRARLPKAVEQLDEDRVITPEEWAQIRLNLAGEGTVLLCDLALDCGLRYEEVTALRPMDVVDGDEFRWPAQRRAVRRGARDIHASTAALGRDAAISDGAQRTWLAPRRRPPRLSHERRASPP